MRCMSSSSKTHRSSIVVVGAAAALLLSGCSNGTDESTDTARDVQASADVAEAKAAEAAEQKRQAELKEKKQAEAKAKKKAAAKAKAEADAAQKAQAKQKQQVADESEKAQSDSSDTRRKAASAPAGDAGLAAEVLQLVNAEREKVGCEPVHRDARIEKASLLHSQDMAEQNYFDHQSKDGRSPWDRMRAAGYTAGSGENIAAGQSSAAAVMDGWMKSDGHRANIVKCSNKAMGVGVAKGGKYGIYWTQGFGTK